MIPAQGLLDEISAAISTGTMITNELNANQIVLSQTAFTPSKSTVAADLTPADYGGYAPIDLPLDPCTVSNNPIDDSVNIDLPIPAGGIRFQCTANTNLPQTIYGFALLTEAGVYIAGETFLTPIVVSTVGQLVCELYPEMAYRQSAFR